MDSHLDLYGIYSDIAWDQWLGNPNLIEMARERYDQISRWNLGSPIAHVPTIALDYLLEAMLTHSLGFFRSSIFCCAGVLDLELKRSLLTEFDKSAKCIQGQTFGQSIRFATAKHPPEVTRQRLHKLALINKIRNEVSVHPCKEVNMISCEEDETLSVLPSKNLEQFFQREEIEAFNEEASRDALPVDLLEKLSVKVLWWTKRFIGGGPLIFSHHAGG